MAFVPFTKDEQPTMAAFNERFQQAIEQAVEQALADGVKIEVGSYVGTGTQGASNPTSLTFGFVPKMVLVAYGPNGFSFYGASYARVLFWIPGITSVVTKSGIGPSASATEHVCRISLSGKTLSWYRESTSTTGSAGDQMNAENLNYYYIAIG